MPLFKYGRCTVVRCDYVCVFVCSLAIFVVIDYLLYDDDKISPIREENSRPCTDHGATKSPPEWRVPSVPAHLQHRDQKDPGQSRLTYEALLGSFRSSL